MKTALVLFCYLYFSSFYQLPIIIERSQDEESSNAPTSPPPPPLTPFPQQS